MRYAVLVLLFCAALNAFSEDILIVSDEWPQMEVLEAFLETEGGYAVEKVQQEELPGDLSGYHGVIQFVHGKLSDEAAQAMMDYTKGGGRLLVLHHGVSSGKKDTKGWYDFLGLELDRSENAAHYYEWMHDVTLTFVNLQPGHYITSHKVRYPNTETYSSSDQPSTPVEAPAIHFYDSEVFLNHQFTDGREKTVLYGFRFEHPDTGEVYMQDRAGWYKAVGEGWLFYFQPGHAVSDFEQEAYCQILMNCFTWEAGN